MNTQMFNLLNELFAEEEARSQQRQRQVRPPTQPEFSYFSAPLFGGSRPQTSTPNARPTSTPYGTGCGPSPRRSVPVTSSFESSPLSSLFGIVPRPPAPRPSTTRDVPRSTRTERTNSRSPFTLCVADRAAHPEDIYKFEVNGVKFFVRTAHNFNWNGYVVLPVGHPDFGVPAEQLRRIYRVHNGVSFSDAGCIGFSTCERGDYCCLREIITCLPESDRTFRDFDFVKSQTEELARQVARRMGRQPQSSTRSSPSATESELTERLVELFSTLLGVPVQTPNEQSSRNSPPESNRNNRFDFTFRPQPTPVSRPQPTPRPQSTPVSRPQSTPVSRPEPTPVPRPQPTPSTSECPSVPEGYVVVDDSDITPEIRSAVNLFKKMGFDTVEVIRPSGEGKRPAPSTDDQCARDKMTSVLEELLRTTAVKNRSSSDDDDDLPDLVSDDDDEDDEDDDDDDDDDDEDTDDRTDEESSKNASTESQNVSENSDLSSLDYFQLLALETLFPGSLNRIMNRKEGEEFCLCGECGKDGSNASSPLRDEE
ncbi:hypothetical protein QJ856_gp0760 [Tupanvirus deep ocean]|uniref:Uncharacterized protein n=2 Tax=Tupanvirus TaxID=2094720 RepID=A0AC62A8C8_9VIRU|nr:hypothetical protein QJ856_gp0760 [Tupanvirus deep ocean]QKU33992.1 hypothetical protein [Tupanvirus deep ocean]